MLKLTKIYNLIKEETDLTSNITKLLKGYDVYGVSIENHTGLINFLVKHKQTDIESEQIYDTFTDIRSKLQTAFKTITWRNKNAKYDLYYIISMKEK